MCDVPMVPAVRSAAVLLSSWLFLRWAAGRPGCTCSCARGGFGWDASGAETNMSSDLEELLQEVVTVNTFVDPNNDNPLG